MIKGVIKRIFGSNRNLIVVINETFSGYYSSGLFITITFESSAISDSGAIFVGDSESGDSAAF